MEQLKRKVLSGICKFKYALLILAVGLALLIIPFDKFTEQKMQNTVQETGQTLELEKKLEHILSDIQGAGNVKVLLTDDSGKETLYQTDISEHNEKTVTVKDNQRNDIGLVRQVNSEIYRGALIVCEGADFPSVRLAITEAVSKVTGLGADKISIQKMK